MKVCFVTDYLDTLGGQQRVLVDIANELSKDNRFDIYILLRKKIETNTFQINENVHVLSDNRLIRKKGKYFFNKACIGLLKYFPRLGYKSALSKQIFPIKERRVYEEIINCYQFDIVIGLTPFYAGILSTLDIKSKKIGWMHSTFERYFETKDAAWNLGEIYSQFFRQLDDLIVLTDVSSITYAEHLQYTPKVMNNPVNFKSKNVSDFSSKSIIFVGRIDYKIKGLNYLLDISERILDKDKDIKINVFGNGKDFGKLKEDVLARNIGRSVILHGEKNDIQDEYLNNSVCVVTSLVEGFGLIVLEAMENGLPVISFNTEGPSELIIDGENGFLIDKFDVDLFADKVLFLLNHPEQLSRMGNKAKKTAEHYSIDCVIEKWKDYLLNFN